MVPCDAGPSKMATHRTAMGRCPRLIGAVLLAWRHGQPRNDVTLPTIVPESKAPLWLLPTFSPLPIDQRRTLSPSAK